MQRKILIADSNLECRESLRGLLEHHGYFVECAADAGDAIRLAIALQPDLLITDAVFNDGTLGVDIVKSLMRVREAVQAVFVTDSELEALQEKCAGLPVAHLLARDVDGARLIELVEELFEEQHT